MSTRSHPINGLVMVASPVGNRIHLTLEQHNPYGGGAGIVIYASPDDLRALGDYCHIAASEIAAEIQAKQEHQHD